jgi:hypothetical protein
MRSTRHRRQAGQSITEAVVATALLGIAFVVALGTIDASIAGGHHAVRQAWALCMVRETTGAIKQASWASSYGSPDPHVVVNVSPGPNPPPNALQTVTVTATDPDSGVPLYAATFLKAWALRGNESVDTALPNLASACPRP